MWLCLGVETLIQKYPQLKEAETSDVVSRLCNEGSAYLVKDAALP